MKTVEIYDFKKAYFFIENKVRPVAVKQHSGTKKIYFVFYKDKTKDLNEKWYSQKSETGFAV